MKHKKHRSATARRRAVTFSGATASLALLAALALASCQTLGPAGPAIAVSDQRLELDTVTVGRVASESPGWLVIHGDSDGAPGPVLGWVPVKAGVSWNARVRIDAAGAPPKLWAMLHVDSGSPGRYEFPGPDAPVSAGGRVVMKSFKLNQGYVGSGGMGGMY